MTRHVSRAALFAGAALLTFIPAGTAGAGEAYYLLMFGSQREPNRPNYSHTFATFVKVTWPGDGPCPPAPAFAAHTISWLPANGKVRLNAPLPEPGRNWELHETIQWCLGNDMRVSLWGPYAIEPGLYHAALRRIAVLESGQVRYKGNDAGRKSDRVSNCIHAVAELVEGPRVRVASPGWGEPASFYLLREMRHSVLARDRTDPWICSVLGLDEYPIVYRDWENPRSGALRGPVARVLGRQPETVPSFGPP